MEYFLVPRVFTHHHVTASVILVFCNKLLPFASRNLFAN